MLTSTRTLFLIYTSDDGVHAYWFDVPFGITPDTHMHSNVLVTRGGPCQHGLVHNSIRRKKSALPLHLHYFLSASSRRY